MSLLARLESRFGRYAVPNVTVILIAGQVLLFIGNEVFMAQGRFDFLDQFRLYPSRVLQGEVWRLVTFLFDPPITNVLFAFFFWYLFYLMGTVLETTWSAFRYNAFLTIGYAATVACAFGIYSWLGIESASNGFLYGSVFLAFARLYPDFTLMLFFILPVKIKWLALIQWCFYGLTLAFGHWMQRAMVLASILNYLVFFGRDIARDVKHGQRRMQQQAKALKSAPPRFVHKCRICGLTSDESPRTQFRYCSKCAGHCCYCPDHLQDHAHVTEEATAETT